MEKKIGRTKFRVWPKNAMYCESYLVPRFTRDPKKFRKIYFHATSLLQTCFVELQQLSGVQISTLTCWAFLLPAFTHAHIYASIVGHFYSRRLPASISSPAVYPRPIFTPHAAKASRKFGIKKGPRSQRVRLTDPWADMQDSRKRSKLGCEMRANFIFDTCANLRCE